MITLITVSDSWNHFTQAIKEYEKRLSKTVRIIEIAPEKSIHPHIIVKKETERIIQCIEKSKGPIFLCDEGGKDFSTLSFHTFIANTLSHGSITFIIGGSYGVDLSMIEKYVSETIRLSHFTLPHGLALLILIEQIYRIQKIETGSGYHHMKRHI